PIPAEHVARAVSVQNGDGESVLAAARILIALRRSSDALREGSFSPLSLPPLLGFDRVSASSTVRCIFNLGDKQMRCDLIRKGGLAFSCGNLDREQGTMGPLSACILELPA